MRSLITAAFVLIFSINIFGQELIPDKQFMLGCTNVGSNEQVTHYINAVGEVWQWNGSSFVTGGVYSSSLVTTGNADFNSYDWPGFNFNWFYWGPHWSLGLYKVTNSKQPDKYFYLDARDSYFGSTSTQDFFIYFDNADGTYNKWRPAPFYQIVNGNVVRIWDVFGWSPTTSGLQNYWSNALVVVNNGNDNPRLIWGPYPNTAFILSYYKIYKLNSESNFQLYATSTSPEFVDTNETLISGPPRAHETVAKYKITAVGCLNSNLLNSKLIETGFTNTVEARVQGFPVYKIGYSNDDINTLNVYRLNQNYPNPFNPITTISFTLLENSFVILKVYNVLGGEIATLVNELKEPGNHNVTFDASRLVSGVYYYEINVNNLKTTKKMLLAK
jgi:hypothetical protein